MSDDFRFITLFDGTKGQIVYSSMDDYIMSMAYVDYDYLINNEYIIEMIPSYDNTKIRRYRLTERGIELYEFLLL